MRKRIGVVLVLLAVFTTSCDKKENLLEDIKAEKLANVSYGSNTSNTMDVYLPADRNEETKVVVLIHGGSWYSGDKGELAEHAEILRQKGFAVVNLNYRLVNTAGTIRLSDQQNDIRAAINYVYSHAPEWRVSNKIGLLGASAGGHLALLYAYSNQDAKVKTVVSMAGPANLTDTRNVNMQLAGVVEALLGASLSSNPQLYADASPIYKVTASATPTLIFHGRKDVIVPVQQSIDLKAKLDQANVTSKLVIYETTGHEVLDAQNTSNFTAELEAWFKANI